MDIFLWESMYGWPFLIQPWAILVESHDLGGWLRRVADSTTVKPKELRKVNRCAVLIKFC